MENKAITTDEYVDRKTAAELTEKVTGQIMEQLTAEYRSAPFRSCDGGNRT